jgi:hypothetical protein
LIGGEGVLLLLAFIDKGPLAVAGISDGIEGAAETLAESDVASAATASRG